MERIKWQFKLISNGFKFLWEEKQNEFLNKEIPNDLLLEILTAQTNMNYQGLILMALVLWLPRFWFFWVVVPLQIVAVIRPALRIRKLVRIVKEL